MIRRSPKFQFAPCRKCSTLMCQSFKVWNLKCVPSFKFRKMRIFGLRSSPILQCGRSIWTGAIAAEWRALIGWGLSMRPTLAVSAICLSQPALTIGSPVNRSTSHCCPASETSSLSTRSAFHTPSPSPPPTTPVNRAKVVRLYYSAL